MFMMKTPDRQGTYLSLCCFQGISSIQKMSLIFKGIGQVRVPSEIQKKKGVGQPGGAARSCSVGSGAPALCFQAASFHSVQEGESARHEEKHLWSQDVTWRLVTGGANDPFPHIT